MTAAFDLVNQSLSTRIRGDETVREKLALIILRHVDNGERDSMRLANVAFHELIGSDRAETGDRLAKG